MKVLVINCGSSTLKFELFDLTDDSLLAGEEARLAHGIISRIGGRSDLSFTGKEGEKYKQDCKVNDHGEGIRLVFNRLESAIIPGMKGLNAVGHRIVHGGSMFHQPVIIDEHVISVIDEISRLAPLHNRPSLTAINAARNILGVDMPMVAVFDTAFHHNIPDAASGYAIPHELAEHHNIRRYGFHGIAHRDMAEQYSTIISKPLAQLRLITIQLGNGCSAAAVKGGISIDTSMGFTPLEGLVMGTRSGDIDPSIVRFLSEHENVDVATVDEWLNTKSGLFGVSGISGDMRELLTAEKEGNKRASLAIDMFCYRVKKYIGAYLSVLNGADAIIFGGGIGENSPEVRERICSGMDKLGIILDKNLNNLTVGSNGCGRISAGDSNIDVYVIPVDEARLIARDTIRCLL
ncbi:MAG: acetate kinase [Nitrospirae bacterium]|nr:acetate kinase [Nitrospirota bacterium]